METIDRAANTGGGGSAYVTAVKGRNKCGHPAWASAVLQGLAVFGGSFLRLVLSPVKANKQNCTFKLTLLQKSTSNPEQMLYYRDMELFCLSPQTGIHLSHLNDLNGRP